MAAAPKNHCGSLSAALLAMCWTMPALSKQEPLLEYGLGVGAVAFEDYRGSDTSHVYPLPVPYLVYNGKFLKADRDGVRGTLFNQDRVELNLSVNATTPVRSDRERSGMPDLRPTVELGPSFELHVVRGGINRVVDRRDVILAAVARADAAHVLCRDPERPSRTCAGRRRQRPAAARALLVAVSDLLRRPA